MAVFLDLIKLELEVSRVVYFKKFEATSIIKLTVFWRIASKKFPQQSSKNNLQQTCQKYLPRTFFHKACPKDHPKICQKNCQKLFKKSLRNIVVEEIIQKKCLKHHEIPLCLVLTFIFYLNPARHTSVYINITNYVN